MNIKEMMLVGKQLSLVHHRCSLNGSCIYYLYEVTIIVPLGAQYTLSAAYNLNHLILTEAV